MVRQIIKEAMNQNPLGLKEAVEAELRSRITLALEAKMTDAEVLSAAKALAKNGKDPKTKSFGQGLVDFYDKEGSFTPAQVGGLQNIMKNASFQMAKESAELDEALVDDSALKKALELGKKANNEGIRRTSPAMDSDFVKLLDAKGARQDKAKHSELQKHWNKGWDSAEK